MIWPLPGFLTPSSPSLLIPWQWSNSSEVTETSMFTGIPFRLPCAFFLFLPSFPTRLTTVHSSDLFYSPLRKQSWLLCIRWVSRPICTRAPRACSRAAPQLSTNTHSWSFINYLVLASHRLYNSKSKDMVPPLITLISSGDVFWLILQHL